MTMARLADRILCILLFLAALFFATLALNTIWVWLGARP